MSNIIYLISTDGHRDSIGLDWYATNEKEIKQLIYYYNKEHSLLNIDLDSFNINLNNLTVTFKEKYPWKGSWEERTYYLHKVYKI